MNEEEFYGEGRQGMARLQSGEVDFGAWWRDANDRTYRASLIVDTGEVYLFRAQSFDYEVVARTNLADLEQRLEGWAEMCEQPNSLAWLRGQLEGLK